MIKIFKSIQLEEVPDYVNEWEEYFIDKYNMRYCIDPKKIIRNTSNLSGTFPSDNYIYEYEVNDILIGMLYVRRTPWNLVEFIIIDLEKEIPMKSYGRTTNPIQIDY